MTIRTFLSTFSLLSLFLLSCLSVFPNEPNTDTLKHVSETKYFSDEQVAERLDALSSSVLFKGKNTFADTAKLNKYNFKSFEIPQYSDEEYKVLFDKFNTTSPFPFVYNEDVRKFIDLYAQRRRSLTSRMLGLAAYYFPLFEEKLDMYKLPLELKYLAVIESALNPVAVSRAGASGLWQFMYGTGKIYGLEVSSFVDDRYDPYKATIAACEHFVDLYNIYNDWALVLAAYNAGSGNVNRAIRKSGGKTDYWEIRRFMPRETQNYVPVYIAAAFVMAHASEHNLYPVYPGYLFMHTDTITIRKNISFEQISEALEIPLDEIVALNPTFKKNFIPSTPDLQYRIKLPYDKAGTFLANEEEIYNFKTLDQLVKEESGQRSPTTVASNAEVHIVKKGESLGLISRKYGCTVTELQKWNKLKGTSIHPGQKLSVSSAPSRQQASPPPAPKPPVNTKQETYTVQSGESLRDVAVRYACSVDQIRLWNRITNLNIKQGQELVIHIPVYETPADTVLTPIEQSVETTASTPAVDAVIPPATNKTPATANQQHTSNATVEQVSDSVSEAEGVTPQTVVEAANEKAGAKFIFHVVQKGDTLWSIANRYDNVTIEEIKQLNSLNDNNLKLGQKLRLPVKSKG